MLLVTIAGASPAAAADLVLVNKGRSVAPIVIPDNLPPRTRDAVDELARYIEKTTGSRPQIIERAPISKEAYPASAIWVGYQPALKTLFPKTDFEFKFPEEILLIANDKHLAILGSDVYDAANSTIIDGKGSIENVQIEYGTANAIYTFLQDKLNVRWLWPGELGEDIDTRETLAIAPFEYRYHPQIRGRSGVLNYSDLRGDGGPGYGKSQDWVRQQRLQYDSLSVPGGHAFGDWWGLYHDTHTEYFALQKDGVRGPFNANGKYTKLCQSNPAVWDRWLKDVEETLKNNPHQTIFNASPNDGYSSGICWCDNCTAWDAPEGKVRSYGSAGKRYDYVAMSDRYTTFANKLAEKLKARYPDKKYYVYMYAYGPNRPVPVHTKPADNVLIGAVANFYLRDGLKDSYSPDGETFKEQFEAWGKIVPQMTWRPNIGSPVGFQQGMPDIDLTQTAKDLKLIRESNVIGIFMDSNFEHWATQGPQNYLLAQLAWNPDADAQHIMDDYYHRAFGPAGATLKNYWQLMEDTRNQVQGDDGLHARPIPEVYNDDFFTQAYDLLKKADQQIDDYNAHNKALHHKRIEFVRRGLDWTQLVVQNMTLMVTINPDAANGKKLNQAKIAAMAGKVFDSPEAVQIRANWLKMRDIANDQAYPLAINWGPVRPFTPRMAPLFPGNAMYDDNYMDTKTREAVLLRRAKADLIAAGKDPETATIEKPAAAEPAAKKAPKEKKPKPAKAKKTAEETVDDGME